MATSRPTARAVLAVSLLLPACSDRKTHSVGAPDASSDAGGDATPRLRPLHAEPNDQVGGRIVDDAGATVLLRGVNVNALAEYWKGTEFDTVFPLSDADMDAMAGIGWNSVRLLLSWSRVEPNPGEYDEAYLAQVDDATAKLSARGIYTIVDLHQDAWGATLAASATEACPSGASPALGWDGAPGWATLDGGAPRCTAALRELSPAVRAAWGSFWTDTPGPGGVGVRTRYVTMLGELARRYAREPSVAGFDVMNEPNAFGPEEGTQLAALYTAALAEIRSGETAGGGFPHLVLFEPSALWSTVGSGPPPDFDRDRDVVYAPHLYTGGFTNGPITRGAFETAVAEAAGFGGAPLLSGEWGSGPERALSTGDGYFLEHQALQDEFRLSATLWTWRESCGDAHHAGDLRAGRIPGVWGEFEVDCATNTVTSRREELVNQLRRAFVRVAPGELTEGRYDPSTGSFTARGVATSGGAAFSAFYPASKHGAPEVSSSGLSHVRVVRAPGDNAYLLGVSSGGEWSLDVAASGG